jgi:predicted DNA-binding WGR domain protein
MKPEKSYLELVNDKNHKFYELFLTVKGIRINYGRIGSPGKIIVFRFKTHEESIQFYNRQLQAKLKRGYKKSIKGKTKPRIKGVHPLQLKLAFDIA